MQLYSQYPRVRAQQVVFDVVALAAIAVFVSLGVAAGALVGTLAGLGQSIEDAGNGLEGTMSDAARALANVPLIGQNASSPFTAASSAGAQLAAAGQQQQELVGSAALLIGLAIGGLPVLVILLLWLPRRVRFARRAASVRLLAATNGGLDLLALRALGGQRPEVVLAVGPDPVGAWRAGDRSTVRMLAELELRSAGVRAP